MCVFYDETQELDNLHDWHKTTWAFFFTINTSIVSIRRRIIKKEKNAHCVRIDHRSPTKWSKSARAGMLLIWYVRPTAHVAAGWTPNQSARFSEKVSWVWICATLPHVYVTLPLIRQTAQQPCRANCSPVLLGTDCLTTCQGELLNNLLFYGGPI